MRTWYIVKVKYLNVDEKNNASLATGVFLFDAVSYTNAERRTNVELQDFLSKEFTIDTVTKTNIHEVFFFDKGEYWWKAKIQYDHIESEKEKKVTQYMMLPADNIGECYSRLEENLKPLLHSWDTLSLQQTHILNVFPHYENNIEKDDN